jgi:hypothetical protein
MKVAMVKHNLRGKIFWFEIPTHLEGLIKVNSCVICDTKRGRQHGVVVGTDLEAVDVAEVMGASGATFPLRKIIALTHRVRINAIKIPKYMGETRPHDEKIAKRFLEFYHTGQFNTDIVLDQDNVLVDGYSAYLVAQKVGLDYLWVTVTHKEACTNA